MFGTSDLEKLEEDGEEPTTFFYVREFKVK